MEAKSLEEMRALVKEMFGEAAEVAYADHQWVIYTNIEERFDPEQYKDRDAYELYENGELERWAWKNGHSSESLAEVFDSYDEDNRAAAQRSVEEVRRKIADGFDFEACGLADYRDRVLAYAEQEGL